MNFIEQLFIIKLLQYEHMFLYNYLTYEQMFCIIR